MAGRTGPLAALIDNYKFHNARAAYRPLAELLLERLPELPANTVVVPIPTISRHIRQRGYDHMALIGRLVSARRDWTYSPVLRRLTNTTQRGAGRVQRLRQAASAYRTEAALDPTRPYLIVDDVVTTGATLNAAVQALRHAGATTVYVVAIARQPLDDEGCIC